MSVVNDFELAENLNNDLGGDKYVLPHNEAL